VRTLTALHAACKIQLTTTDGEPTYSAPACVCLIRKPVYHSVIPAFSETGPRRDAPTGRERDWERETEWLAPHLQRRGVVGYGERLSIVPLRGGVSAEIFEVRAAGAAIVVKRALPQLEVAATWLADPRRMVTEGRALELAHSIAADAVPGVIDLDQERAVLCIERAADSMVDWRSALLAGTVQPRVAERLGEVLGNWHRESRGLDLAQRLFADRSNFETLRLEPFYLTVAERYPRVGAPVRAAAERLRKGSRCLVHGDFSPKNVLADNDRVWVLDWEVAHYGEPVFDLAFMLTHLFLKSIHRPAGAASYERLASVFLRAYGESDGVVAAEDPDLPVQIGCLLLARVAGKSPAQYLTDEQRAVAEEVGLVLLSTNPLAAWEILG
jgi:tRNA A-37 threonylcarbamoyl transferase component Bud32